MPAWTTPSHVTSGPASSAQFNEETVDNLQHLHDRITAGSGAYTADAGGNIVIPHGLGQMPTAVVACLAEGNTAAVDQVAVLIRTTMDATNFVILVRRSDTGAVLPGVIRFNWIAFA